MNTSKTHHIQTTIQGKYIVQEPNDKGQHPLLVGFHGYGENAEQHMHMLQQIPVIQNWFCCAIQALHPFYNAKGQIGFTWMTSLDRELRIQENVNYVNAVVAEIKKSYSINDTIVFHGFSQGTAMACRAALLGDFRASGVILLKFIMNLLHYIELRGLFKGYVKWMKKYKFDMCEKKSQIINLFKKAGILDKYVRITIPKVGRHFEITNVSIFENIFYQNQIVTESIYHTFKDGIGIFKRRIFDSINPFYWI